MLNAQAHPTESTYVRQYHRSTGSDSHTDSEVGHRQLSLELHRDTGEEARPRESLDHVLCRDRAPHNRDVVGGLT